MWVKAVAPTIQLQDTLQLLPAGGVQHPGSGKAHEWRTLITNEGLVLLSPKNLLIHISTVSNQCQYNVQSSIPLCLSSFSDAITKYHRRGNL
jgi:hypothetical protein